MADTVIPFAPNVEPATLEGWREQAAHLRADNDRLRDLIDSHRVHITDARVQAANAWNHAIRQAAQIAERYSVYRGDEKQYPSAVGGDIAAEIMDLIQEPNKRF